MPLVFGPVPSRRLGRSLGINNIPPKACSYSCVYCQVGRTAVPTIERRAFYPVEAITAAARERVEQLRGRGEPLDYLTFVPDGEPTLDAHLGEEIDGLRGLGVPVAVITNASLLWRPDVRRDLERASWVSVKVDAATPAVWAAIQRPHPGLDLARVLDGLRAFAARFPGTLVTETMLVRGVNDSAEHGAALADLVAGLRPQTAYVAVPTRPPAEPWALPPDEATVNQAVQVLRTRVASVELLIGHEGTAFSATGDAAQDLLSIAAVHPLREDAAEALLARNGASRSVLLALVERGELVATPYLGRTFYVRRFVRPGGPP